MYTRAVYMYTIQYVLGDGPHVLGNRSHVFVTYAICHIMTFVTFSISRSVKKEAKKEEKHKEREKDTKKKGKE